MLKSRGEEKISSSNDQAKSSEGAKGEASHLGLK